MRGIQLNDAHIFCTAEQAATEVAGALAMIADACAALDIRAARVGALLAVHSAALWEVS
ncbi:hypothetical protein [Nocardia beijingensis]|uniref:Threonine--tRNA ligase n=1 Tax=Nocardia beijingensis TaxID=95162 RepID=A0ABW7W8C5_9NOCA